MNVYQYDGKRKKTPIICQTQWQCYGLGVYSCQCHYRITSEVYKADQSASKCKRMMTPPKIPKVTQKCIKERKKLDIFPPVKSVTRSQNMCFSDGR